jgi:hypothetical protein
VETITSSEIFKVYIAVYFLGTSVELWKATISLWCLSVRPSVRPHGITRPPLDETYEV